MKKDKKKIYIIPGFGETTRMKNYREIKSLAKSNGYEIISVKINWYMDKTMSDYIKEVEQQIPCDEPSVIFGFSFGAFIAYSISKQYIMSDFIFCSTSPYFKSNIKNIPCESKEYFGKKFINDLSNYKIHSGNKKHAWFLVGDQDWDLAIETSKKISEKWLGKTYQRGCITC